MNFLFSVVYENCKIHYRFCLGPPCCTNTRLTVPVQMFVQQSRRQSSFQVRFILFPNGFVLFHTISFQAIGDVRLCSHGVQVWKAATQS